MGDFEQLISDIEEEARANGLAAVAELLGHSSPALAMARYGHAYAAEKTGSAMALERFCAGPN